MSTPTRTLEACPICAGTTQESLLTLDFAERQQLLRQVSLMHCPSCDFAFIAPADQQAYDAYYATVRNDLIHDAISDERAVQFVATQAQGFQEILSGPTPLQVLDYGCGGGDLVRLLAKLYPQHVYTGFDINIEVGDASASADKASVTFTGTLTVDATYDLVILSHVAEHFVDLAQLAMLTGLLTDKGQLYVEVPDPSRYKEYPRREFLYYIDRLHVNHFSLRALSVLASRHGLQVMRYGKLALPYKDGGLYPSHYVFCGKASAATMVDQLCQYFAKESERASPLAHIALNAPLLVYGFGDHFFRSHTPGGPLSGRNIVGVIDRRWESLRETSDGARYPFMSLKEALVNYPHAPIAIALSWGAEQVAEAIRIASPAAQIVII